MIIKSLSIKRPVFQLAAIPSCVSDSATTRNAQLAQRGAREGLKFFSSFFEFGNTVAMTDMQIHQMLRDTLQVSDVYPQVAFQLAQIAFQNSEKRKPCSKHCEEQGKKLPVFDESLFQGKCSPAAGCR